MAPPKNRMMAITALPWYPIGKTEYLNRFDKKKKCVIMKVWSLITLIHQSLNKEVMSMTDSSQRTAVAHLLITR